MVSRLEIVSKNYDTTIIIGEYTHKSTQQLHEKMYKIDSVTVKGKSNKVNIYSIKTYK